MLEKVRSFFKERGVLEVDCPSLSKASSIDAHIDILSVSLKENEIAYLHSSPEYGMKRLLAEGIGDIYQMSHVFRKEEVGPLHNPEFTMVEWYRLDLSLPELIQETLCFLRLFLSEPKSSTLSYREALLHHCRFDYVRATPQELLDIAQAHSLSLPKDAHTWDKDTLLNLLMSFLVEPHLGREEITVVTDFPATQAALAKIHQTADESVAARFEIYYRGIELANGYHELTDPIEQEKRLIEANTHRQKIGKQPLPLDVPFLEALRRGLPDCCGVAVGFDRLLMLRMEKSSIHEVLPFSWGSA